MLAGRDLQAGGAWLGIDEYGRLGVVTNYRELTHTAPDAPSRGDLVPGFLAGELDAEAYLARLERDGGRYAGFNLLFGTVETLHYCSNRGDVQSPLPSGVFGLSNHMLNTPWPKVERVTQGLAALLGDDEIGEEALIGLLADRNPAPDAQLPDTGIGLAWERLLSAPFIVSPAYGTRCTTVLRVTREGRVTFYERQFDVRGEPLEDNRYEFMLEPVPGAATA